jgi:hypothetical protein
MEVGAMQKLALFLAACAVAAGAAVADEEPIPFVPGPGGDPWEGGREVVWIDNPDFASDGASSEVIDEYDLQSETASDLLVQTDTTIQKATWWGVYYHYDGSHAAICFHLRFYHDSQCRPEAEPFVEYIIDGDANETHADGGDMFSQYVYWHCICLELPPGQYWFTAQCEHEFPPQWFRIGSDVVQLCECAFKSTFFSYPEWVPGSAVFGTAIDVSQMFEDECEATATDNVSWGAVKGLYRD